MSKKATTTEPAVRVLKNGTCPNLSGKSTLSYRIGVNDAGEIMLQLVGNSNPGCFNNEWVKYADVQELLAKEDQGKAITSFTLVPLYRGKSTNSPSFLFAVLKQEGLVKLSESKKRCYDRCSDAAFLASIGKLIEGKPVADQAPKAKVGKSNKAQVASEPGDVPDNKPSPEAAKRGRPKKAEQVVDVVAPQAEQAEMA